MRNAGLDEAQAGIKITGRNINNLRYADDTTLMAESEEELKSLLMKVKEESEKVGLKLNIWKTKIIPSGPISSVQFSCSVMPNSSRAHEPQHARPPCPSPTPALHLNSCALSQWCCPTISSSIVSCSSCPQSSPVSGYFQMSQLFASGGPKYWSFSFNINWIWLSDWIELNWIERRLLRVSHSKEKNSIETIKKVHEPICETPRCLFLLGCK